MGKPYIYTRTFKQISIYDYGFWVKLEKNLKKLAFLQINCPPEETKFSEYLWHWPLRSKYRDDLYNIIKLIARVTGTKIMWKWSIPQDDIERAERSLLIIGENTRVIVCMHVLHYTIEGILKHEDFLKKTERERARALGYKTITTYVKLKTSQRLFQIIKEFEDFHKHENFVLRNRLESYIMGRYKLDYKRYGQLTNVYDNAISPYFYPRRMML